MNFPSSCSTVWDIVYVNYFVKVKSACVYSNSYANFILANYYDGLFWEEHDHQASQERSILNIMKSFC